MLLIGSRAMNIHYPGFREEPKDSDYICTIETFEEHVSLFRKTGILAHVYPTSSSNFVAKLSNGVIKEFSIAWPGTTNETLLRQCHVNLGETAVASPDMLLALKLSHRYKKNSPHFLKTMRDIKFLRSKGVTLSKELHEWSKLREEETYTYSHPSLDQDKQHFFRDLYKYDHDSVHQAIAIGERPAYTKFSKAGQEVKVSKLKWNQLELKDRLLAGLEESYVLAIERSLVPHPGVLTPKQAFDKALEKVCTSITSGWFREFCWEHYEQIQELYSDSYVDKFQAGLENKTIRLFNESK